MSTHLLLEKFIQSYLNEGIVKVPEKLIQDIESFCRSSYAFSLQQVATEEMTKTKKLELDMFLKEKVLPLHPVEGREKQFNLTEYFGVDLNLNVVVDFDSEKSGAFYENYQNVDIAIIGITFPPISTWNFEETLYEGLLDLSRNVRHEVTHLTQEVMKIKKMGGDLVAFRKATLTKTFNIHGMPSKNIETGSSDEEYANQPHGLQDVEFYAILSEKEATFREVARWKKPNETLIDVFKAFVGSTGYVPRKTNEWFRLLKTKSPLKWKKAVKELYKKLFQSP
jgi:hypothetical protein